MYRKKKGSKKTPTRKPKVVEVAEPIEDVEEAQQQHQEQDHETIESQPSSIPSKQEATETVTAVEGNTDESEVGISDESSSSSRSSGGKVKGKGAKKTDSISTPTPQLQVHGVSDVDPAAVLFAGAVADAKRVFTAPFMIYDREAKQIVRNPAYNRETAWGITQVQGHMMSTLRRVKERETLATPRELLSLVQQSISGVLFSFTNIQPGNTAMGTSSSLEQTPLITPRGFPFAPPGTPNNTTALSSYMVVDSMKLPAAQIERFNAVLSALVSDRTADALFVSRVAHCLTQSTAGVELLNKTLPLLRGRLELEEAAAGSSPNIERSEAAQAALRTTSVSIEDLQSHLQTLKSSYEALTAAGGEGSVNVSMVSVLQESIYALVLWSTTVHEECASLFNNSSNASNLQPLHGSPAGTPSLLPPAVAAVPPPAASTPASDAVKINSYNPETGEVIVSRDSLSSRWGLTFNRQIELVGMANALRAAGEDSTLLYIAIQTFKALPLMELNGKKLRRVSSVSLKENGCSFVAGLDEGEEEAQERQHTMSTAVKAAGLQMSFTLPKIERDMLMRPHETDFVVLSQGGEEAGGQMALFALQRFDTSIDWGFNIFSEKNEVEMVQHNEEEEEEGGSGGGRSHGRDGKAATILWTETQWHMRIDVQQLLDFTEERRKPKKKTVVGGPVLSQAAYDFLSAHKDRLVLVKVNNVSVEREADEKAAQAALEQSQVILLRVQVLSPAATIGAASTHEEEAEVEAAEVELEGGVEKEQVKVASTSTTTDMKKELEEVVEVVEAVEATEEEIAAIQADEEQEQEQEQEAIAEEGEEVAEVIEAAGEEGEVEGEEDAIEEDTKEVVEGEEAEGGEVDASYMEEEQFFDTSDAHGGKSGSGTKRVRGGKRSKAALEAAGEGEPAGGVGEEDTNVKANDSDDKKKKNKKASNKKLAKGKKAKKTKANKKLEKASTQKRGRGPSSRKVVEANNNNDEEEEGEGEEKKVEEEEPIRKKGSKRKSVAEEVDMMEDLPNESEEGAENQKQKALQEEDANPVLEEKEEEASVTPKKRGRKRKEEKLQQQQKQLEEEVEEVEEGEVKAEKKSKKASKKIAEVPMEDIEAAKAAFEESETSKLVSSETPGDAAMRIAAKSIKGEINDDTNESSPQESNSNQSSNSKDAPIEEVSSAPQILSFDKHALQSAKPLTLENNVTIQSFDGNTLTLQRESANVPWGLRVQMGGDEVRLMSIANIGEKQRTHPFAKALESNTSGWTISEINKSDVSLGVRTAMDTMKKAVKLSLVLRRK